MFDITKSLSKKPNVNCLRAWVSYKAALLPQCEGNLGCPNWKWKTKSITSTFIGVFCRSKHIGVLSSFRAIVSQPLFAVSALKCYKQEITPRTKSVILIVITYGGEHHKKWKISSKNSGNWTKRDKQPKKQLTISTSINSLSVQSC